ncbi:type IV pilus modification protein PilV [Acinetobacter sp. NIPH 298]|uniref:type IV pilus modification protein PilV n=1 Tax=Acinetobacter sp. NIPH 298 TaxID=1217692 RepID=UPI0002CE5A17|nr:type IV pilus modification protein PilV [Acinetobacter sp. NIPH 298]ENW97681.1 type IV pilus modification protein PilV [Acinetobacter sp. NIPH 298]
MNNNNQKGVGLVEVLVALILLAIAVLGFAALQLKAVDASAEAGQQVLALTIARDLAELMRANPQGLSDGKYKIGAVAVPSNDGTEAYGTEAGNPEKIAAQDLQNAALQASENGMNLAVSRCPTSDARQCIYVAWGETSLVEGSDLKLENCIKDGAYVQGSHCLFLEAY